MNTEAADIDWEAQSGTCLFMQRICKNERTTLLVFEKVGQNKNWDLSSPLDRCYCREH